MKIFYPYSEVLPSEKARALQVINTVSILAGKGVGVELYAGLKKTGEDILKMYGLSASANLKFISAGILREFNFLGFKVSCRRIFEVNCTRFLKKKRDAISRDKFFFIYTRHLKLAMLLLKRFPHIPLIYEAHEIFSMKRHSLFHSEKFVFENAKGIVFISHSLREKVKEYFPLKAPLAVIPDGVNINLIEEAKKRYIPGEVVYVGQLYPWKGVKTLVRSMNYIRDVKLTIVGGGNQKEKRDIEHLIESLGLGDRIKLTGFIPHKEALRFMAGAKVLALPLEDEPISRHFTSPLKLFEYMASGVPIAASSLPTLREILSDESALFVKPGDAKGLAIAIDRLLKDAPLARSLGDKAYELSREYSWEKRAERIIEYLGTLV